MIEEIRKTFREKRYEYSLHAVDQSIIRYIAQNEVIEAIENGEVIDKEVSYSLFYEEHWVIVENVPARVCHQCGEKLFTPEVVEKLQNIIWSKQTPRKKIEAPVFDLASYK